MEITAKQVIEALLSDRLEFGKERDLMQAYLADQKLNNQLVFSKIESEYGRIEAGILGKLLYLPYSVNPELTPAEEKEYTRLLSKCFEHYTNRLSADEADSDSIWILYVISDVLFHSSELAKYLDKEFLDSAEKVLVLNTDDYEGEVFILLERMFVILNYINTLQAKHIIQIFKQHPNKEIVEFIVKKHEA